ncbi:hypothetical protein JNB63_14165 [Microbacterium trichothecenolyticum]|nr:hypothetical protein [Microbacterium trichothecenolyticum]
MPTAQAATRTTVTTIHARAFRSSAEPSFWEVATTGAACSLPPSLQCRPPGLALRTMTKLVVRACDLDKFSSNNSERLARDRPPSGRGPLKRIALSPGVLAIRHLPPGGDRVDMMVASRASYGSAVRATLFVASS